MALVPLGAERETTMLYAHTQAQKKLIRWLDRHLAELRPAQVEAVAWNVLRMQDMGGAVAILRYDPQKDAIYLEPIDETA